MRTNSRLLAFVILFMLSACSSYRLHDYQTKKMPDGKYWMTQNLNLNTPGSYCYDSLKSNCDQYGRLYTWEAAVSVCRDLGKGWRLPSQDDWRLLAKQYGGVFGDSTDNGKRAFTGLMTGGASQFNAALGGGKGTIQYRRIDAHGFYWTASEVNDSTAWFINFGKGRPALYLQKDGEKTDAFSVRCVKD